MACYYISILVPILKINGADYIRKKFQYRCQIGEIGLDATASIIFSQLLPVHSNFKNTIQDLIDVGVIDCYHNNNSNYIYSISNSKKRINVDLMYVLLSTTIRSNNNINNNNNNNNNHSYQQSPPQQQQQQQSQQQSQTNITILPSLNKCIIAKTFISILQLPLRLNTINSLNYYLPETFNYYDSIRLSYLRDIIDRISIISSIMINIRQILVKYQIPPNCIDVKSEIDLHNR